MKSVSDNDEENKVVSLEAQEFRKGNSIFYIAKDSTDGKDCHSKPKTTAEKHSFLQFALTNFREGIERYNVCGIIGGSLRGTIKLLEYLKGKKTKKETNWTWKEVTDMVKYSPFPILMSLLKCETDYQSRLAVDTFTAIMRYMGDLPLANYQRNIECVYTLLVICHHHPKLRDEVYCQLMKQTTNNKSPNPDSCILGWRLLAITTAYFKCSDSLLPYLLKYLQSAAQDDRRMEQSTAEICLQNLNQTNKYGGRRNVPSEHELEAITKGEMSRMQAYYLPGGMQQFLPTASTTVVLDIIHRICHKLGVHTEPEFQEFSLYCIVEGDLYTMPLESDEYIMDLIAELERNPNPFYLIFCRSAWYFPLRLDSELYIDIIHHQVTPDYLEGFLLVLPSAGTKFSSETINEIARIAALLHRSFGMIISPSIHEIAYLLPKPVFAMKLFTEMEWTNEVCKHWDDMTALDVLEAKAQCLDILQRWTLFGSCFFGIKMSEESSQNQVDHILAVNKLGINILHMETHETLWRFNFQSIHCPEMSPRGEDDAFFDMELGNHIVKKRIRLQMDHAHEVARLIQQYNVLQKADVNENTKDTTYPLVMIKV